MEEVVSIVGALFSLLSLTFFYNNGNISKLEVFKSKAAHEFFSESSNYSTDFSIFFPSWNIDLRARPWALWNFLRSTSPLTHRCRNIIPPARYFNLALSTRQGPEKKLHRFSLSSLFFFSHSLHFPRKAGCVRFLKNVASNIDGKWKQFSSWSDVARACVWNGITWRMREKNRIVEKSLSTTLESLSVGKLIDNKISPIKCIFVNCINNLTRSSTSTKITC